MVSSKRSVLVVLLGILLATFTFACGNSETIPLHTMDPKSDVTRDIQGLYIILFWAATAVFFAVMIGLVYITFKFKRKPTDSKPPQTHGNRPLEILWTILPSVILIVILIPTWQVIYKTANAPEGSMQITVTGNQWWWEIEYPELGVKTSNEVHVPIDVPVEVTLLSKDVIHAFWVPQITGKKDMVPGLENKIWFTAEQLGTYYGVCVEFSGDSQSNMKFELIVDSAEDFEAWKTNELAKAIEPEGLAAEGMEIFNSKGCGGCHTIEGNPYALGIQAPILTHIGSRNKIAAGMLENNANDIANWIRNPEETKPGNLMTANGVMYNDNNYALSENDIQALVAYIQSLK